MPKSHPRTGILLIIAVVMSLIMGGCGMSDDAPEQSPPYDFAVRPAPLNPEGEEFCSVNVQGQQEDTESYIAQVVQCESGGLPSLESLKAQAIAARSYAMFTDVVEGRALTGDTRTQDSNCGTPPTDLTKQAVAETSGVVMSYNDTLVKSYYKAGAVDQSSSCRGIGNDWSNTEHMVTYNEGRRGDAVQGGYDENGKDHNRGDMGQNSAYCLATRKNKKALDILRFFYGEDIGTIQLSGSCVKSTVDPEVLTDGGQCSAGGEKPEIIERSEWGARAPRAIRPKHTPVRFAIHHTVTANGTNVSGAQTARLVQGWHMDDNGWSDIGYHFLIDQKGNIYRGNPEDRVGAHVGGNNTGNIGISFMGQFHPPERSIAAINPPDAQLKAAGQLLGHLAEKYGVTLSRDTVKGHREHPGQTTACPGDNLLAEIDQIIEYAGSGIVCRRPDRPYDEIRDTPEFDLASATYNYVKVEAVSPNPAPYPENIGGFEVDSVFFQRDGGGATYASEVVSSSGDVQNASGALGAVDNDDCDARASKAAIVPAGSEIVLKFGRAFSAGDLLTVVQGEFGGLQGCDPGGTARVWASPDGQNWVQLSQEVIGNTTGIGVPSSSVSFANPRADETYATGQMNLRVDTSADVQEVEYFVGGQSIGTGTDWEDGFRFAYEFGSEGVVMLTARAKGADGQTVARDTIEIELDNTFRITKPRGTQHLGHLPPASPPGITMAVSGGPSGIVRVSYEADGTTIGESSNASGSFAASYTFQNPGERHLVAYGYNSDEEVIATAEKDIFISEDLDAGLEWVRPFDSGWYTPSVTMRVRGLDPDIVSVDYLVDDQAICRSDNLHTDFKCTHTFENAGWVQITAVGYDTKAQDAGEENKLAEATITILVTDENGTVPDRDVDSDRRLPSSNRGGGGSFSGCSGGTPQGTAQELAQQLVDMSNQGQIVLQSNPAMNLREAANGQASTCHSSVMCPSGSVYLKESLLAPMVKFAQSGSYTVTSIATGRHSTRSMHYRGQAVDVGAVGGTIVRPATPGTSFYQACKQCGAVEALYPPNEPSAHWNHIHCGFP